MLEVLEPITAPDGLGVVAEYRAAVGRTTRPLKMTLPGPYTLSGRLVTGPGTVYPDRLAAAEAFVPLLRAELGALADAGATIIQLDEPSPAIHPDAGADFASLFNAAIEPVVGRVRLGAHLCFGNYLGRPLARADLPADPGRDARLPGGRARPGVRQPRDGRDRAPGGGHRRGAGRRGGRVDVKNYYLETPEDVAERIDRVLASGVPAERLTLVPDCGFSQTARWATIAKLRALVAGRDLVAGRTST